MAKPEVHPSAFEDLNREFYGASPAGYFDVRLRGLLTMISDGGDGGMRSSGVSDYSGLRFNYQPDTEKDVDRFAALETTVLKHHTAEALLRLYLGHADRNPCPWLAISSLRSFGKFKADVESLRESLPSPERMNDVLEVFCARSDRSNFDLSAEEMTQHEEGLAVAIREAANAALGESNVYNAAKHGLALIAGQSSVSFAPTDQPDKGMSASGLALSTLQLVDERWRHTTTWLDVKRSILLIHLWTQLIDSLWESARLRYLNDGDTTKLITLKGDELKDILRQRPNAMSLLQMSMDIWHVDHGPD